MASIVTQIQPFLAGGMFPALALGQPGGLATYLHPHPGHSSGLALSVVRSLGFLQRLCFCCPVTGLLSPSSGTLRV